MNQTKRLVFYLFVNVLVSACTILSILWLWDRPDKPLQALLNGSQPAASTTGEPSSNPEQVAASTPSPTKTSKPAEYPKGLISIYNIYGIGDVANEKVILNRTGSGELEMTGWKLEDTNGNIFVFPELTLYKDGAINIHTSAGINTVIDLYWNKNESVWQVGETATLLDPLGNIQATYQIP